MAQGSSNLSQNIAKVGGTAVSTNAGNADAGTQRIVLATNQAVIPVSDNGASLTVDGTFWQATQPVSQSGTWSVQTTGTATSAATTTAYATSLVVKASTGTLYTITGYNSKSTSQFIQVHDSATLPADAAIPKIIFFIPPFTNFSYDMGHYGRLFSAGITICNSSTGPTKTIGSADCWFDVTYK